MTYAEQDAHGGKAPRKRRADHNEVEKARREHQREQLERLGTMIPEVAGESRPSALQIILATQRHVLVLRERIAELEGAMRAAGLAVPPPSFVVAPGSQRPSYSDARPQPPQPSFISIPAETHTLDPSAILGLFSASLGMPLGPGGGAPAAPVLVQSPQPVAPAPRRGRPPKQPRAPEAQAAPAPWPQFVPSFPATQPAAPAAPYAFVNTLGPAAPSTAYSVPSAQQKIASAVAAAADHVRQCESTQAILQAIETLPGDGSRSSSGDSGRAAPTNGSAPRAHRVSSFGLASRRDSSILLPTSNPQRFVYVKRNSAGSFSSALPSLFEDDAFAAYADAPGATSPASVQICCAKCHAGVQSLPMIDCDRCRTWYHLRCVGIAQDHVPMQWTCPECPMRGPPGGGVVSGGPNPISAAQAGRPQAVRMASLVDASEAPLGDVSLRVDAKPASFR